MKWPHCTPEGNDLKRVLMAILDSETLSSAESMIDAALIQGGATFLAGLLALFAGILAYKAATQQNRMAQKRQAVKALAYKNHISVVLKDLRSYILAIAQWADKHVYNYPPDKSLPKLSFTLPDDIKSENWENHALLPEKAVKQLYRLYRATAQFQKMLDTIAERDLKVTDDLPHDTFIIEHESGRTIKHYDNIGAFLEGHSLALLEAIKITQDKMNILPEKQGQTTAH